MESKMCSFCKQEKSVDQFRVDRNKKTGLSSRCKLCLSHKYRYDPEIQRRYRASPSGRAVVMWLDINRRSRKKPAYHSTEVNMTRQEFLDWAIPALKEFQLKHPHKSPSIDRIDRKGHYELSNLRIISQPLNYARSGFPLLGLQLNENSPAEKVHESIVYMVKCIYKNTNTPIPAFLEDAIEQLSAKCDCEIL